MSLILVVPFALATAAAPPTIPALAPLDAIYADLDALYRDLHANPELSLQEEKTSAKMAERSAPSATRSRRRSAGTASWVLKNGTGPTVLLRGDMDALPVEEKTGLPYASKVKVTDAPGRRSRHARLRPRRAHDVARRGRDAPGPGQGPLARHAGARRAAGRGGRSAGRVNMLRDCVPQRASRSRNIAWPCTTRRRRSRGPSTGGPASWRPTWTPWTSRSSGGEATGPGPRTRSIRS